MLALDSRGVRHGSCPSDAGARSQSRYLCRGIEERESWSTAGKVPVRHTLCGEARLLGLTLVAGVLTESGPRATSEVLLPPALCGGVPVEVKIRWVPSLGLHAYRRHVFVDGVSAGWVAGERLAGRVVRYALSMRWPAGGARTGQVTGNTMAELVSVPGGAHRFS